jgi:HEAT repeat protein
MSDSEAVLERLRSPDTLVRSGVLADLAAATGALSAAIALALVDGLASGPKALQRQAADLLGRTEASARPVVLERLRAGCRSEDAGMRWGAAFALGRIGVLEVGMIGPLLEALESHDGDRRWAAAELVVACGRMHRTAVVDALLGASTRSDSAVLRKMALYALRDLAPEEGSVRDAFVRGLGDGDAGVRMAALSGVCRVEPPPDGVCTVVLAMVSGDPEPGVRRAATSALGYVGRGDAAASSALDAAARSDDPGLRRAALTARRRLES